VHRRLRPALALAAAFAAFAIAAQAQDINAIGPSILSEVMPGAERFERAEGTPPVRRAYRGDELLGYVFVTSDFPPEPNGYSGPIRTVVGVTLDGHLTGVRITDYNESRRYDWGDFLSDPWLLDQYIGKHVSEQFRVGQDIDGISQVTISVRALSRGIRDAARRVALAYAGDGRLAASPLSEAELDTLSWYELRMHGAAVSMAVVQSGRAPFTVSLIHVPTATFGAHLVGRRYEAVTAAVERRGGADHVILYTVEGTTFVPPLREGWSIEQGGEIVAIPSADVITVGMAGGGLLVDESSQFGVLLLDDEDVDVTEPMTFALDRGRPELGTARVAYTSQAALARLAALDPTTAAVATAGAPPSVAAPSAPVETPIAAPTPAPVPEPLPSAVAETPSEQPVQSYADEEDEGLLATTSWLRVGWVVLVIALGALAFVTKNVTLRWVSLATTLVVLGWVDGGFLSISHVTGLIWVGPSAITSDLPLLILVAFTLVSVVLVGRIFCGFLCPFGALQDFVDRLVPKRFKRELPKGAHRVALKSKYVVLAVILLPAIAGSHASLYQYFEPFGTVFFVGRNALLWAIAGSFLAAAAVVPRFYCRYVCPLGASLALASAVTLRRIPRVEQCNYCRVCEQHCPTRAIDGPALDFKECVRCNDCEVRLVEKRGVCRHEMAEFRSRLIPLKARTATAVAAER